jgi:delta 1-pyrroline-5-carboxylate dehydrogenase
MPAPYDKGFWIEPTIRTGLPESSCAIQEEIFGPCVHLQPFDREEEAIALANDTEYGLATTIWTIHLMRAHRVAAKINVGITWINCWFLRDLRTSFGGQGKSGIGRDRPLTPAAQALAAQVRRAAHRGAADAGSLRDRRRAQFLADMQALNCRNCWIASANGKRRVPCRRQGL